VAGRLYDKRIWRRLAAHRKQTEPLCRMCLAQDPPVIRAAVVADHVEPHRGDINKFILGELQSLCAEHHSSVKQRLESGGFDPTIGPDGWPVSKDHPAYGGGKRKRKA
jgi:hypothetical protein